MKITRLPALLVTATLLGALAACGGSGASSPEEVAEKAMRASLDDDHRTACELTLEDGEPRSDEQVDECVTESEESMAEAEKLLEDADEEVRKEVDAQNEEMETSMEKALDDGPTEVSDEKDDKVTVTYELDGNEMPVPTRKVDGNWYIDTLTP